MQQFPRVAAQHLAAHVALVLALLRGLVHHGHMELEQAGPAELLAADVARARAFLLVDVDDAAVPVDALQRGEDLRVVFT